MAVPPSSSSAADVEAEIDALYALPPGEFTAARDALAKRLRLAGARADAERVKALRKPSPVAAAVNQLARVAAAEVAALRAAGDAQRELVASQAPAAAQRAAREEVGRRVDDLVARAQGELGLAANLEPRLRLTLQALAAWGSTAEAPAAGRLADEVAPPGFEVLAGLALASTGEEVGDPRKLGRSAVDKTAAPITRLVGLPATPAIDLAAQGRSEARRRAAAALAAAEAEAVERGAQMASAERALMKVEEEVAGAAGRVAALADEMRRLASELAAAEGAVAELDARRGVAAMTLAAAREAAVRAGRAVEQARVALDDLPAGP